MGALITVSGEVKVLWLGKVKAHSTVKGDYGIMKENVYGYVATRYGNCQLSDKQCMNVWAPYPEGWRLSS